MTTYIWFFHPAGASTGATADLYYTYANTASFTATDLSQHLLTYYSSFLATGMTVSLLAAFFSGQGNVTFSPKVPADSDNGKGGGVDLEDYYSSVYDMFSLLPNAFKTAQPTLSEIAALGPGTYTPAPSSSGGGGAGIAVAVVAVVLVMAFRT